MTVLLDASVLIPLQVGDHTHHAPAHAWFAQVSDTFATSPITQGALVRYLMRFGQGAADAARMLSMLRDAPGHEFWADDVDYLRVRFDGVIGHRQVTDAYLAQLAREHRGRLATFGEGLAAAHPDVVELVPVTA